MKNPFARAAIACMMLWSFSMSPVHAADAPAEAACQQRPLNLDLDRLRQEAVVQSLSVDPSHTTATVLFADGDVLRVGSTGCVTPMLSARLWVARDDGMTDEAWFGRARWIAEHVLQPARAAQVATSLANGRPAITHVEGGLRLDSPLADGAGYSLMVVRAPRDGLGASLSLVLRNL